MLRPGDEAEGSQAAAVVRLTAPSPAALVLLGRVRPHGVARAVAIAAGRIVAIGPERDVLRLAGQRTETIGHAGAAIIPGFIDAHLHFLALARRAAEVDCSRDVAESVAAIGERIREAARGRPPGTWIRAFGYDEFFLAERRPPSIAELDAAAPMHPVRLLHRTGHAAVLNSPAFRLVGIAPESIVLNPGERMRGKVPAREPAEIARLAAAASERLIANGITTFHDPTPDPDGSGVRTLRALSDDRVIAPRVRAYGGEATFAELRNRAGHRFRQPGIKIVVDERSDGRAIAERVAAADRLGAQVAIHAVEEGPLAIAIGALRSLGRERVRAKRHRIEHATLCPPPLSAEIAASGAIVVTHPQFLARFGDRYRSEVASDQWPWLYPLRTFVDGGVPVAFGSDAPIVPPNPLEAIRAAVEPRDPQAPRPLSLDEALRLHTAGGAGASGEESELGSLAPGSLADAVLLEPDPFAIPAAELAAVRVTATVIGGRVAWRE